VALDECCASPARAAVIATRARHPVISKETSFICHPPISRLLFRDRRNSTGIQNNIHAFDGQIRLFERAPNASIARSAMPDQPVQSEPIVLGATTRAWRCRSCNVRPLGSLASKGSRRWRRSIIRLYATWWSESFSKACATPECRIDRDASSSDQCLRRCGLFEPVCLPPARPGRR
jgi:hypothetical protein